MGLSPKTPAILRMGACVALDKSPLSCIFNATIRMLPLNNAAFPINHTFVKYIAHVNVPRPSLKFRF